MCPLQRDTYCVGQLGNRILRQLLHGSEWQLNPQQRGEAWLLLMSAAKCLFGIATAQQMVAGQSVFNGQVNRVEMCFARWG